VTEAHAAPPAGDGPGPGAHTLKAGSPIERGAARFRRVARLGGRSMVRGVVEFYYSSNLTFASSIAYYSLLSFFPFVLLVFSILGHIASGHTGDDRAALLLIQRALPRNFEFLSTQIVQLQQTPFRFTVLSTVVILWASMGVFGAVTNAVNHAWGVEKPYSYWRHKFVAFVMMSVAGVFFIVALLLMGAVQVVEASWFTSVLERFPGIHTVTSFAYRNAIVPVTALVLGLVYYYAPNAQVRLRDVWFGAVLAALLWRGALEAFGWYLRHFGRFTVHGSVSTVVVFLAWVFLSAVIFLYGVEVTAAYARLRKHLPHEAPAAPSREP
jgi:membrane protein